MSDPKLLTWEDIERTRAPLEMISAIAGTPPAEAEFEDSPDAYTHEGSGEHCQHRHPVEITQIRDVARHLRCECGADWFEPVDDGRSVDA